MSVDEAIADVGEVCSFPRNALQLLHHEPFVVDLREAG